MQLHCLLTLALLTITSLALSTSYTDVVLHESRVEQGSWEQGAALENNAVLLMRIGLKQSNLDRGYDLLMEVSHPDSPNYGEHFTAEQTKHLFAPLDESIEAVRNWLLAAGTPLDDITLSIDRQWLQVVQSAQDIGKLLHTTYHEYEHSSSGKKGIGCEEYYLPKALQAHIDYITPGVTLSGVRKVFPGRAAISSRKRSAVSSLATSGLERREDSEVSSLPTTCQNKITPQCIMDLYKIAPATSAQKGNELGIFEDYASYIDQDDLNIYFSTFYPTIPNGTFPIVHDIDGAKNENNKLDAGTEVLDFQAAYPIIWPQNSVLFLTDDPYYEIHHNGGFLNTFLDGIDGHYCNYSAFGETGDSPLDPKYPDPHQNGYNGSLQCGVYQPTNVISISYAESEITAGLPRSYIQRQCNEYMKLGLQGVTVVVASGDTGVASNAKCGKIVHGSSQCNEGCIGQQQRIFNVNFPDSCPYVLSVGATALSRQQGGEVAWDGSSGGFSNVFPRPKWQQAAVDSYFSSSAAPDYPYYTGSTYGTGIYNRTGRGIPDVSAIGAKVPFSIEGGVEVEDGTSIATPVFAAVLTRINNERLAAGKSTVGFVNPVLYANAGAFNDITHGSNPGCNTTGFKAGKGWDPVTGLGSPDYHALLDVFMKLQ